MKVGKGNESAVAKNDTIPDSLYTDLDMAWTITSLLTASGRYYLLQPIIVWTILESLLLTDADGQGVLCMDRDELMELRKKPISASRGRTTIPAFMMWEWYAPLVELPCGALLKGATLVSSRPISDEKEEEEMGLGWIEEEFDGDGDGDGMYAKAVRLLVNWMTHYLETDYD